MLLLMLNKIRVRCVGHPPVLYMGQERQAAGGCFFALDAERQVCSQDRILPAFCLWGKRCVSSGASDADGPGAVQKSAAADPPHTPWFLYRTMCTCF